MTPYAGLTLINGTRRTLLRGGLRWNVSRSAMVGLEAARKDSAAETAPANAIMLRAELRF